MSSSKTSRSSFSVWWWLSILLLLADVCNAFGTGFVVQRGGQRQPALFLSKRRNKSNELDSSSSSAPRPNNVQKKKTTQKQKGKLVYTMSTNDPPGTFSSRGNLKDRPQQKPKRKSNLGVASASSNRTQSSSSSPPMSKKERQRTGNGKIDSSQATNADDDKTIPIDQQAVQVLEAKRGAKTVTIVRYVLFDLVPDKHCAALLTTFRGMRSPLVDRKALLKQMKKSLGSGGTMVDGVLEIQGAYASQVVTMLQRKGYQRAKKIGGK